METPLSKNHVEKIKYFSKYSINETPKYKSLVEDDFINDDEIPIDEVEETPEQEVDVETPEEESKNDLKDLTNNNQPEKSEDDIQNRVIKLNLSAVKKMNSELSELKDQFKNINIKLDQLNKDVEEVKEPSNIEKLTNKTEHSFPFNRSLNKYWEDNWYSQKHNDTEDGIYKLEDGSYVANYEDLIKNNNLDI